MIEWLVPAVMRTPVSRADTRRALCARRYRCGQLVEVNAHSLFSKWFSESGKLVSACVQACMQAGMATCCTDPCVTLPMPACMRRRAPVDGSALWRWLHICPLHLDHWLGGYVSLTAPCYEAAP